MSLELLTEMSNKYGKNPEYVLAGGGNTSYKDNEFIYVKASGVSLAEIKKDDFVKMHRSKLGRIFTKKYSQDEQIREAEVLKDLLGSRFEGEEDKRPSVETLLHEVLPFKYVLHIHPSMANGMTCGRRGREIFDELFDDAVWVEPIMPGYILAVRIRDMITDYFRTKGSYPSFIFLENHGVFISSDDIDGIDAKVEKLDITLSRVINQPADLSEVEFDRYFAARLAPAIRSILAEQKLGIVKFVTNKLVKDAVASETEFNKVYPTFTPDHMVYCSDSALFLTGGNLEQAYEELAIKVREFVQRKKYMPRIIGVKDLGFFACAKNKKEADIAADVFLDAVKVSYYASFFGQGKPLPESLVESINNWEVEKYRKSVSFSAGSKKRLSGKITIITGGAQGIGKGIAEDIALEGGYLAIADLNKEAADILASELCSKYGRGSSIGLEADVSDEDSVKKMIESVVLEYGGIDLFISNAGVVRAASLDKMELKDFELVTRINYTGYFICAKFASEIMKLQYRFNPDFYYDIIQINSKSGLVGSNKNSAYSGSKFGGIGLTQSFALELVEYNIKVNSVCPGNYLEGPLWSDPKNGLFVQYLNAGKVPGAKTVADVKRAYELRVPMKRGCLIKDLSRAIYYLVEQEYETGQALSVTGGQHMLK